MKIVLGWLVAVLVMGCVPNRIYRYYDFPYRSETNQVTKVICAAGALGSYQHQAKEGRYKVTHRGNPYELLVTIKNPPDGAIWVRLLEVDLRSVAEQPLGLTNVVGTAQHFHESALGETVSYFRYAGLTMAHTNHVVRISAEIAQEPGVVTTNHFEIDLNPDYKESKSNDTWDRIMSV